MSLVHMNPSESPREKKITFFTPNYDPYGESSLGVKKKIKGQVSALKKYDLDVDLFGYEPFGARRKAEGKALDIKSYLSYLQNQYDKALERICDFNPGAIYVRYNLSNFHFIYFLKKLRKYFGPKILIILEVATFPYDEEFSIFNRIYIEDLVFRRSLHKYVDFIVTFSGYDEIFKVPTIKSGNGIDLDQIRPQISTESTDESINLIGVSNLAFWTGYDRLIAGLSHYRKNGADVRKVCFHIVGDGPSLETLKELTSSLDLVDQVFFHPPCSGRELDLLFTKAHLAVANLAVHRKGMVINPDLKNREYCARGIPFVTSTKDPDFSDDFSYILRVPTDDSPIDIDRIINFIDGLYGHDSKITMKMRSFAQEKLDWKVKIKPVIETIQTFSRPISDGK